MKTALAVLACLVALGTTAIAGWRARNGEAASLRIRSTRPEGVSAVTTIATLAAGRETGYPVISAVGDSLLVAWTDPDEPVSLRTAVVATPVVE